MKGWLTWRLWLWLTALIPILLIILLPGYSWVSLAALLWVAIIGIIDGMIQRRLHKQQLADTIASTQKQWIIIMNHHRHDWMNDLQVLFGYIRLGKYDHVAEYVDRIKGKMLADSSISKLGQPQLTSFLYGFRTLPCSFQLEVSFHRKESENPIVIDDEQAGELITQIISAYRLYSSKESQTEQILKLVFEMKENGLHIRFNYDGNLISESLWTEKIEQQLNSHSTAQAVGKISPQLIELQLTKA